MRDRQFALLETWFFTLFVIVIFLLFFPIGSSVRSSLLSFLCPPGPGLNTDFDRPFFLLEFAFCPAFLGVICIHSPDFLFPPSFPPPCQCLMAFVALSLCQQGEKMSGNIRAVLVSALAALDVQGLQGTRV